MTFTTLILPVLVGFFLGVLATRTLDYFMNRSDYLDDTPGFGYEGEQK